MKYITIEKDPTITIDNKLYTFFNPDYIYIPVEGKLLVGQNDLVTKGEKILEKKPFCTSVSGRVLGLNTSTIENKQAKCVVIENDFREKRKTIAKVKKQITIKDILDCLEKANSPLLEVFKSIISKKFIVISAIHDEPYVLNHIMALKEHIDDLLEMMDTLCLLYKASKVSIIIKATDSDIIEECLKKIGTYPNIELVTTEDYYLLGKEEFLLTKLGKTKENTLYLSVLDLLELVYLVKYGKKNNTKYITISGDAIKKGKVIRVKKYTKLNDIVHKFIDITADNYVIVVNNLLNTYTTDLDLIITEQIDSLHFMKTRMFIESPCISCGKCVKICPQKIDPIYCYQKKKKDKRCLECGLCSYICPSYINLSSNIKGESHEK